MTTVAELEEKIEDRKRQIAQYEARKKALIAKEREQARKYKEVTLTAIGETVLKSLGADWTDIDLDGLQGWLTECADDIRSVAVTEPRTPAEAKAALDAFKRTSKKPKRGDEPEQDAEADAEPSEQADESEADGREQPQPYQNSGC